MLDLFWENSWRLLIMTLLLLCSGFFSGSETAFFNIPPKQAKLLKKSKNPLERLVGDILDFPKKLLSCLLFANMMVNILFFAFSSVFIMNITHTIGAASGAVAAFFCFSFVVIFGEMLPKSLAFSNSIFLSSLAVLPCIILLKILNPIMSILDIIFFSPFLRLFGAHKKSENTVNTRQLKNLFEKSMQGGLITAEETYLFNEILEFGLLKARQVMQPRVDMDSCSITTDTKQAQTILREKRLRYLPIYDEDIDDIKGYVDLRDILLEPSKPLKQLVKEVHFIPEQKPLESVLVLFQKERIDMAIVVDEYGGIAGRIDLQTIINELFGTQKISDSLYEPITQIGPLKYRLRGDIPLHDWKDAFDISMEELNLATVGGYVTSCLGKIPVPGDVAKIKNLVFTVDTVDKNRIKTIVLSFTDEITK